MTRRASSNREGAGLALAAVLLVLLFCLFQHLSPVQAGTGPADLHGPSVAPPAPGLSPEPYIGSTPAFTFALSSEPGSLDPARWSDRNSLLIAAQLYETLVDYQPGSTLPVPGLAQSWSVSPDGLVWTFNLRPGVQFHDGTPLDADAVVYNFQRWWDPAHPYHRDGFDFFQSFFGGFKGDPDCLLSGVAAAAPDRVLITLTLPLSPLPEMLTVPAFGFASPQAIQAGTLDTAPVGSGPFRFVDWVSGDHVRLAANPAYWGDSPWLEQLTFRLIPGEAERFAALQSGAVQAIGDMSPGYVAAAALDPDLKVLWAPPFDTGYLGINRAHPPLDNLLVRQAIAHAVNRPAIVEQHYNAEADIGLIASQLLPPVQWGYDPEITGYEYDPALARALLAQAGYTNGLTTTLWVLPVTRPSFPNAPDIAASMQADLLAVGISTTQVLLDWSTYLSRIGNGEADLFMLGWTGDYGHPDNFFYPILCDAYLRFGPRDDVLCSYLDVARGVYDQDSLIAMYQWAGRRVHDTLPLLPIGHARSALLVRRQVAGLVPVGVGVESFAPVFLIRGWIYLPLVARSVQP